MLIVRSRSGIPIRLTTERWAHITSRHPDMATQQDRVLETIADPDMIQKDDFGELLAVRYYANTPLTQKHLVAAYREVTTEDGFVLTADLARRPSAKQDVLWRR